MSLLRKKGLNPFVVQVFSDTIQDAVKKRNVKRLNPFVVQVFSDKTKKYTQLAILMHKSQSLRSSGLFRYKTCRILK